MAIDPKELFYESVAEELTDFMTEYDGSRRGEVIFEEFLRDVDMTDTSVLDMACGVGVYTRQAADKGASVTTADIGEKLVRMSVERTPQAKGLVAALPDLPLKDNYYDIVISSETIEHTKDPYKSTDALIRAVKPGGLLIVTVPNKSFWYFAVLIANCLRLRPYRGYEHWVHYNEYRAYLESRSMEILEYKGIHLYPFVVPALNGLLRKLDRRYDKRLGHLCVNLAVCARKQNNE